MITKITTIWCDDCANAHLDLCGNYSQKDAREVMREEGWTYYKKHDRCSDCTYTLRKRLKDFGF